MEKYTILVCDDEKDLVSVLKICLEAENYRVLEAYNGEQALDILQKEKVHMVLMDVMMPVMDGYQATMEIRKLSDRALANIPIIAMTANAFEEDRLAALKAGMNDRLAKPIQIEKLFEIMKKYL